MLRRPLRDAAGSIADSSVVVYLSTFISVTTLLKQLLKQIIHAVDAIIIKLPLCLFLSKVRYLSDVQMAQQTQPV